MNENIPQKNKLIKAYELVSVPEEVIKITLYVHTAIDSFHEFLTTIPEF